MLIDIYMEGYRTNGESGGAHLFQTVEADSFEEACRSLVGKEFGGYKVEEHIPNRFSIWGCILYPTLEEARKHFG